MERIPILKMGQSLLVSIQVDMHDRLALTLQDDLTQKIVATRARGWVASSSTNSRRAASSSASISAWWSMIPTG